jgi:hypothetical protein
MNWRRGLVRIWIVFAACWAAAWSWYYHITSCVRMTTAAGVDDGLHCPGPNVPNGWTTMFPISEVATTIVAIPVAVLAVGFVLAWMLRGFRKSN